MAAFITVDRMTSLSPYVFSSDVGNDHKHKKYTDYITIFKKNNLKLNTKTDKIE